jgi:predicted PurR-regulated permease PerM
MSPPAPPSANGPLVRAEGSLATGERFRPLALAALTAVLVALCFYLTLPFLPAVTWAVALAIIAWPLHVWINRHIPRETVAAGLTTLVVVVAILVPGLFVSYQLAREATSAAEQVKENQAEGRIRETLAKTPGLEGVAAWMDRVGFDVDAEFRALVAAYTRDASGLIQGSLYAAFQVLICLFILFHLFRDRASLREGVRRLLPMTRPECDRVFRQTADSVHGNLYASVVTSVIDGVTGGLVFWAVGLPSPVLWGVVMFFLSILPMVGIILVWLPGAVYLAMTDRWGGALAVTTWGVACGVLVDNMYYARLAGGRMRLHQVPTLIAFIGGLAVFGVSGMILGPAILAVTVAVLDVWHRRTLGTAAPDAGDSAAAAAPTPPAGAPVPAGRS